MGHPLRVRGVTLAALASRFLRRESRQRRYSTVARAISGTRVPETSEKGIGNERSADNPEP
jgi:hypothetical protein